MISRVDRQLFSGEATSVTLPGAAGVLTILPRHEPLIALLAGGAITVRTAEGEKEFTIEKGLLEVSDNRVTVLV